MSAATKGASVVAVSLCATIAGGRAFAAPSVDEAARLFDDAATVCLRDNGALWGRSLCGPVFLIDHADRGVIANAADGAGVLHRSGDRFVGTLPDDVIVANTPTEWSGVRWTQIVAPIPDDSDHRHVLIAHELFHRIQPGLKLTRREMPDHHLDTLEGRYLLQLEWRALAAALKADTPEGRRSAIADALAFRWERHRLFPTAAAEEAALEINEGIPEYTGVMIGLATSRERIDYAIRDLAAFVAAPTFVRSFAYATGPAYGLLLDDADPRWRTKLGDEDRLGVLLGDALRIEPSADVGSRAAVYDDGTLRIAEERRETERRARIAALKTRLVDGPVVVLPLAHANFQFNPQTLIALDALGTVYPTMRLVDDWGVLEVESGGALVRAGGAAATVSAASVDRVPLAGDGWRLMLRPGWTARPGARAGDVEVACDGPCPPRR